MTTLFDSQKAPKPAWKKQGNPLFERSEPSPLELAAGSPKPIALDYLDDDEAADPDEPQPDGTPRCSKFSPHHDTRFCPDCRHRELCRKARHAKTGKDQAQ